MFKTNASQCMYPDKGIILHIYNTYRRPECRGKKGTRNGERKQTAPEEIELETAAGKHCLMAQNRHRNGTLASGRPREPRFI